jgi:FKBP-type peptidyl-prolyl cis-trans isomerase FkpA
MIKVSYLLAIVLLLFIAACKESEKETPYGLKYTVLKAGDGQTGKKGDLLLFDFELRDSKDSVWNDSYKGGLPLYMPVGDTAGLKFQDGVTQLLHFLSTGDSVKTSMTVPEFFAKLARMPVPAGIDTAGSVAYTIKAHEIMSEAEFMPWWEKKVSSRDETEITKYLAGKNLTAKKDTSGIYYIIHNSSGDTKPSPDHCVEVNYAGKFLLNGLPFDKNNNVVFSLREVIPGWTLSIPFLAKGDSGTFFIPSRLAYGPRGCCPTAPGAIPRDAPLIFDVKLLNFKNPDPTTGTCQ